MSQTLRILLIDDNPDDRLLAARQLSRAFSDLQIQEIAEINGLNQALAADGFDAVVTDYQLRWSDGLQVLRAVKDRYPDCPVVMFTNTGSEEIAVEAMKAGLSDYVLKLPKYYNRLPAAVQLALERAETQRRAARLEAHRQALSEVSRAFAEKIPEFQAVLELVSQQIAQRLGNLCVVRILSDDGKYLNPVAIYHPNPEALACLQETLATEAHRVDEGLTGRVFKTGETLLIPVVSPEEIQPLRESKYLPYLERFGMYSILIAPLEVRGRRIGTLFVSRDRPGYSYTRDDQFFLQDLADRAALAIDNARLYREAQEVNRLKDEFLATLSHELRTPLNSILGWATLLRNQKLTPTVISRALESIERNAKAQVKLTDEILDVSRIIRGKLHLNIRSIELIPIIDEAINILRPAADAKGIRVKAVLDRSVGLVAADPDRLQQVVWNLLSNAIKFTSEGGQIEVRLERVEGKLEEKVEVQPTNSPPNNPQPSTFFAQIQISDTGMGISPDFLPYAFDRFRQADASTTRSHGGLGLGLAIVRHLVELHGGTVRAASLGIGQGATFTVLLPLFDKSRETEGQERQGAEEPGSGEAKEKVAQAPQLLSGLQVLVVDDDTDTRELIALVLEESGAKVKAIASVAEALEVLRSWQPDLLVSDIGMPEEDGYTLIGKMRTLEEKTGKQIPALALTAYAREEDKNRALKAGFQMYQSKPVEPDDLVAAVALLAGCAG
ncbi:response regulator [Coleofasciculus sp. FACHB-129]|uniref:response regulator n=1 Tax=Cyanophyceae TaxID=3028117 RepID=UPI0016869615|nr:response regulator [Coleofasciculus sp. FACHB-129]MBD1896384.1 response regulator [Coleofasciculus sp. FACHB-129]